MQRIKGAAWVLHDGSDSRAAQLFAVHRHAVKQHPAGGLADAGRQQAQRGGAGKRFPAAAAAEQRQHLAAAQGKRDVADQRAVGGKGDLLQLDLLRHQWLCSAIR